MEKLQSSYPIQIHWRAFELRPPGQPPLPPEYRARIEAARPRLLATARAQYGLELDPGPFGINSRPALIGSKYAEAQGVGAAYHQAIFESYWLEGQDISDTAVMTAVAESVGLAREPFLAALDAPQWADAMFADVQQAYSYGLNAVPALVFDNKYLVSGAQPYAVLAQVTEKVLDGA